VHDALALEAVLRPWGFHPIVLWSENNKTYSNLYTSEKKEAEKSIVSDGLVPAKYDFVITTGVLGRSVNVYD